MKNEKEEEEEEEEEDTWREEVLGSTGKEKKDNTACVRKQGDGG